VNSSLQVELSGLELLLDSTEGNKNSFFRGSVKERGIMEEREGEANLLFLKAVSRRPEWFAVKGRDLSSMRGSRQTDGGGLPRK